MRKSRIVRTASLASASAEGLFLYGWSTWGGLQASNSETSNVKLDSAVEVGGYVCANIDTSFAGKTRDLVINKGKSTFSEHRLLKITVNQNDELVKPSNVSVLLFDEYVPDTSGNITFTLPTNFEGKLGFVFYKAYLRNLRITAFYK
jgi:hypothetical protein